MGQCYKVVNLTKKEVVFPDFEDGDKLFEHSYINNPFMNRVMELIKDYLVWRLCYERIIHK